MCWGTRPLSAGGHSLPDVHLEWVLLSVELEAPRLGRLSAICRLDGDWVVKLRVPLGSRVTLPAAMRCLDRLRCCAPGDLHQPLLLDLHDFSVELSLDSVHLLHVTAGLWIEQRVLLHLRALAVAVKGAERHTLHISSDVCNLEL